jgi:hypothetical protein
MLVLNAAVNLYVCTVRVQEYISFSSYSCIMKTYKNSCRSIICRQMDARLDLYICTHGIDAGQVSSGSLTQPMGLERPPVQVNFTSASSHTVGGAPNTDTESSNASSSKGPRQSDPPSLPPDSPPPSPGSSPLSPGDRLLAHSPPSPPPSIRSLSPPPGSCEGEGMSVNPGLSSTHVTSGSTSGGGMAQEGIQPDPVNKCLEDVDEGDDPFIYIPNLQTTQHFINSLHVAKLEHSGMCHEEIENLHNPMDETELIDPSPLL